jgi:tRNA threonylcarbamoyl adenosine modification protein YeaZ
MELTIDTASPVAGVALTEDSRLVAESSWSAGRGHATELLPAIDRLLDGAGVRLDTIGAIFVNRGPGAYAGLRVGISTALALAFALDADLLGYGRLEADAFPFLSLGRPVCAVHDAGRGEFAWAVYEMHGDRQRERQAPRIGPPEELVAGLPADALVAGEVPSRLRALLPADVSVVTGVAAMRRAATGAALAWERFAAGARDSRLALTPLYLREPNITAPRNRTTGAAPA